MTPAERAALLGRMRAAERVIRDGIAALAADAASEATPSTPYYCTTSNPFGVRDPRSFRRAAQLCGVEVFPLARGQLGAHRSEVDAALERVRGVPKPIATPYELPLDPFERAMAPRLARVGRR